MGKMNIMSKIKRLFAGNMKFESSHKYWDERYKSGGLSGAGSYGQLARYKADIINEFVEEHDIASVVEFGCGDGNQLKLYNFKEYLGYDVSNTVLEICREMYKEEPGKEFKNLSNYEDHTFDISLSIDVIYHLVEDNVFNDHMEKLFSSAGKFVIIYSSNFDLHQQDGTHDHVRHRQFTGWIEENRNDTRLLKHIPNKFSKKEKDENTSHADFFIYEKTGTKQA